MAMQTSLSGYPEWLPDGRLAELAFVKLIQDKFELYGFAPIETRAVEPVETLAAKGETDKEIYVLRRMQAAEDEGDKGIGLHFDLTVPFARYVIENKHHLVFPLRRYQIQKAWRGERPGMGRFREFLQADVDIVDENSLPIVNDLEIVQITSEILSSLPIPEVRIYINNRKVLEGFYRALGITSPVEVLRTVDKLAKIGEKKVYEILVEDVGVTPEAAAKCLEIAKISRQNGAELTAAVRALGLQDDLLDEGLSELAYILDGCSKLEKNLVYADLSVARGLDYYTGTVFEVKFTQFKSYPTIAGGGRYDNLVSDGNNRLPGVGISIGITRILGLLLHEGVLSANRSTPSCVLVALVAEETRDQSLEIANILRSRGIPCEIYPHAVRYGKQIRYAERKGIPYVWFPSETGAGDGEIRDIRTREQTAASPQTWTPPAEDLKVQIQVDEAVTARLAKKSKYR